MAGVKMTAIPSTGGSGGVRPPPLNSPQQNKPQDPNADVLEEELEEEESGLPPWFDVAAPWMASIIFHLGIGLLVLFLTWFIIKAAKSVMEPEPIVIPTSFQDPGTPGGVPNPGDQNSNRDAAQDKIKDITKSDGWAQSESKTNVSSFLSGAAGEQAADAIFRGSGGSTGGGGGNGAGGGGPISPYGTPGGGMGSGPKSNFFGTGGSAVKIVYIIDHSGSLLDNFDFLRAEVKRSVDNLLPVQQFAVVAFSEEAEVLGPPQLQRATTDAKHDLERRIEDIKAQGQNDDMLPPFQHAFEKGLAMKPQLIYFLTDGAFDPKLFDVIRGINKDHKIRINTLAFVQSDPRYEEQLKKLATENGGVYKFVSEKDLGR
jgi:hypothetical protein